MKMMDRYPMTAYKMYYQVYNKKLNRKKKIGLNKR